MSVRRVATGAFTLVEAVVGLALMGVTFGALWGMFFYDNKRITASMERLTALRGGEGIVEALRTDLKNLVPPRKEDYAAWGNAPILLETSSGSDPGGGFDKLTFFRFAKTNDPSGPVQRVSYRYESSALRVLRSINGKESTVGGAKVKDVLFFFRHDGAGDYLTYEIVTSFQGVSAMGQAGVNVSDLMFRGQIDLVDRIAAADRYRWVTNGADSR